MPFVHVLSIIEPEKNGFRWECDCGQKGWAAYSVTHAIRTWRGHIAEGGGQPNEVAILDAIRLFAGTDELKGS